MPKSTGAKGVDKFKQKSVLDFFTKAPKKAPVSTTPPRSRQQSQPSPNESLLSPDQDVSMLTSSQSSVSEKHTFTEEMSTGDLVTSPGPSQDTSFTSRVSPKRSDVDEDDEQVVSSRTRPTRGKDH